MNLLDALIKIFPELRSLDIKILSNIHLNLNLHIGSRVEIKDTKLLVDFNQLTLEEKVQILQTLPEEVKNGIPLLETKFRTQLEDYKQEIGQSENKKILEYFQGKIPTADIPILKASLYLKSLLNERRDTGQVKKDIVNRYGTRGKHISNLCSAGYFNTWIKPLFEEMAKAPDFTIENFQKVYNEVIDNMPFALFVNRGMNKSEIKKIIEEKITAMQAYGIKTLNIHGIGEKNSQNIREVLATFPRDIFDISSNQESHVLVAKLQRQSH